MGELPDQSRQTFNALSRLLDRLAPWLVEVGSWIFGGQIALNLVTIAALITVGPADIAVLVSVTAFACALPLEVAGMVLLRVTKDVDEVQLEAMTLQSFQEAHFPNIRSYFPTRRVRELMKQRRARIMLGYSLGLAAITLVLTFAGLAAALWHMAAWVAEAFVATAVAGLALILVAMVHTMPPESATMRESESLHPGGPSGEAIERPRHHEKHG